MDTSNRRCRPYFFALIPVLLQRLCDQDIRDSADTATAILDFLAKITELYSEEIIAGLFSSFAEKFELLKVHSISDIATAGTISELITLTMVFGRLSFLFVDQFERLLPYGCSIVEKWVAIQSIIPTISPEIESSKIFYLYFQPNLVAKRYLEVSRCLLIGLLDISC